MTLFDLFIVVVLVVSGLFAWVRGLTREIVTLIAIIIAVFADLWFGAAFSTLFGDGTVAPIIGYSVLFLLVFVVASVLIELLIGRFLGKDPKRWDQIAGAVFGLFRGWLLLGLVYLALNIYFGETNPPDWLANSALKQPIAAAADLFESLGLEPVENDGAVENGESSQTDPV